MTNQYECTFIVTPVLSESEAKQTIKGYLDFLKSNDAELIHEEHGGLKTLAYPIKKKTSGIYHTMEFTADTQMIDKLELAFRRDENILRFLTVRLDKYARKYNDDKRKGLVGRNKKKTADANTEEA